MPRNVSQPLSSASLQLGNQAILHTASESRLLRNGVQRLLAKLGDSPGTFNLFVNLGSQDETLGLQTNESYSLKIDNEGVRVDAPTVYGALHAFSTLTQLISIKDGAASAMPIEITDGPAFVHRGLLIDTARHFLPVSTILRTLDGMSSVKLNVLHWHLTDSQSFSFDSYSTDQLQNIVQYARERGIRIIPEFDVPGHSRAWRERFPGIIMCDTEEFQNPSYCLEPPCGQMNPDNEQTYVAIEQVLNDASGIFIDEYLHLGGDEVNEKCWGGSETTKEKIAGFETQVSHAVLALGKKMMVWQELISHYDLPLPQSTIVQTWNDSSQTGAILSKGFRTVESDSKFYYLDCGFGNWFTGGGKSWCDFVPWQKMYLHSPRDGVTELADNVLGAEATIWGELVDEHNFDSKVWPRLSAAAESLWNPPQKGATYPENTSILAKALARLSCQREQLLDLGIQASPLRPEFCEPGQECDRYSEQCDWDGSKCL